MVIGVTAQEDEEVPDGVGPLEAQQILVEALQPFEFGGEGSDVTELGRAKGGPAVDAAGGLALEEVEFGTGRGFGHDEDVGRTRCDIGSALDVVAGVRQSAVGVAERAPHLVTDRRTGFGRVGLADHDAVVIGAGGEVGVVMRLFDHLEVEHLGVVPGHPVHVGCVEGDVSQLGHRCRGLGCGVWCFTHEVDPFLEDGGVTHRVR